MVRRRSTVRFRNGAPQLDRIIRKDVRRLWTSRVGPNGYPKGAFTAQSACSRQMQSAGPGMPGGPISAGPLRNQGNGAPDGPHRQRHSQNGTAADRLSLDGLPKDGDRQTADGQLAPDSRPSCGQQIFGGAFRDRRWLGLPALTGRLGRPGAVMRGSRLGGLLLRPRPAVACHR
jgi:hypothetical protein